MGKPRHNWPPIQEAYVTGTDEETLAVIAERFGVPKSTLEQRAASEHWTEERKMYRKRVQEAQRQRRSEEMAATSAKFDSDSLQIARTVLFMSAQMLREMNDVRAKESTKVNPYHVEAVVRTARGAQVMGQSAIGDSQEDASAALADLADAIRRSEVDDGD